jgi:hypothetical protein
VARRKGQLRAKIVMQGDESSGDVAVAAAASAGLRVDPWVSDVVETGAHADAHAHASTHGHVRA